MRCLLPLLAGTLLSGRALALDVCTPNADDATARTCIYAPGQRYVVNGIVGYPVNLNFGPKEHLKRLEPAFTGLDKDGNPTPTWIGPTMKGAKPGQPVVFPKDNYVNNLPIWPMKDGHSALQVVTELSDGSDQNGSERVYLFDLWSHAVSSSCEADPTGIGCRDDKTTTSSLTFTYPADQIAAAKKAAADKKQAAIERWRATQANTSEKTAVARLKTDVFYGAQNKDYSAHGDPKYKTLAPSLVSDNGFLTQMQWPGNVQIPTITIVNPVDGKCPRKGDEWAPSVTTQGHLQIVNQTAMCWRLHLGADAVLDVWNNHWNAERPDPETGTASPDVVRQIRFQADK